MSTNPTRKNKIVLSDYHYQRDIDNRLLMSQLPTFEVDVLRELVQGSLHTSLATLVENVPSATSAKVLAALEKLSPSHLFTREEQNLTVHKEMRKYYEPQLDKFDENFEPGVDYLQGLLSKVPIHVLPNWYAIPKTSDNIFDSLIEKYLLTPRIYQHYLDELSFEEPILHSLVTDVFASPELKIRSRELRQKYNLTREQFEKHMLMLEFNFVCCLSYQRIDDAWKEVVTPFAEWRRFLLDVRSRSPETLSSSTAVKRRHPHDFGVLKDMEALLIAMKKAALPLKECQGRWRIDTTRLENPAVLDVLKTDDHGDRLVDKLLRLGLARMKDGKLSRCQKASEWLEKSLEERSLALYCHSIVLTPQEETALPLASERTIRAAEKTLRAVLDGRWIYFDDFVKSLVSPLTEADAIVLRKGGKHHWEYSLPSYDANEVALLRYTILERLYELGITAVGSHHHRLCFSVTPFGRSALGE